MNRTTALLLFAVIALIASFAFWRSRPPAVAPAAGTADTAFSAERAFPHLTRLCAEPHSLGTAGNARVRAYIDSVCRSLGLETRQQAATALGGFRGGPAHYGGYVQNVIARLPGRNAGGKAVLVMAHYDSQPNTYGAGDDGAGVAAMLEVARILKNSAPPDNDVLFLFTDGEEMGLLGARAFLQESPLAKQVGVVLNFEGRGSSGVSHMFEANAGNGWVIPVFAKAAPHPFANSLNYEVYKLLPNDTDFSPFKQAGYSGLNHAFIEHLEDYHSMTDTPGNLDLRSLQHHGDNMLGLVKAFGRRSLQNTKATDVTYFNLGGPLLIYYPAVLNGVFIALAALLYIIFVVRSLRRKTAGPGGVLAGAGLFLLCLLLLYGGALLLQKALHAAYPLNGHFYEHNAYNSSWYYAAGSALSIGIFSLFYGFAARRFSRDALAGGALLIVLLVAAGLYFVIPTGTYLFYWPLLFVLAGLILVPAEGRKLPLRMLLFSLPALLLFTPVLSTLCIAFGLGGMMPAIGILFGLAGATLLPLLYEALRAQRLLLPVFMLLVLLATLVGGHLHSCFTEKRPLPTSLWYRINTDSVRAEWASAFEPDFFTHAYVGSGSRPHPHYLEAARVTHAAPALALPAPLATLLLDSATASGRYLRLQLRPQREAASLKVLLEARQGIRFVWVNGKPAAGHSEDDPGEAFPFHFFGIPPEGIVVDAELKGEAPLSVQVTDRSMGFPPLKPPVQFLKNTIPGEGRNSHTTQVSKGYRF